MTTTEMENDVRAPSALVSAVIAAKGVAAFPGVASVRVIPPNRPTYAELANMRASGLDTPEMRVDSAGVIKIVVAPPEAMRNVSGIVVLHRVKEHFCQTIHRRVSAVYSWNAGFANLREGVR